MLIHHIRFGIFVGLLALLVGCGTSTIQAPAPQLASGTCPSAAGPIDQPLVVGVGNGLWIMHADGSAAHALFAVPEGVRAYDPIWSPDGATLAYTLSQPAADPTLTWLPVGMICGIDRSTGHGRALARGTTPLMSIEEASWAPDAQRLLAVLHEPQLDDQQQYVADRAMLVRYDLASNTLEPQGLDVRSPVLAATGNHMAYLELDPQRGTRTLLLGDASGQHMQPVAPPAPPLTTAPPFSVSSALRWSPDGRQLAFAASGGALAIDGRPAPPQTLVERLFGVGIARAHGMPADLWIVDADGQNLRAVTSQGLDDPYVTWSPDGTRIAYTGGGQGGVFVLDLQTLQVRQISAYGDYGGIAWGSEQ